MSANLTAEYVRGLLDCDPERGMFRWRERKSGRPSRWFAGSRDSRGYRHILIDGRGGRSCSAHRLLWLHVTGAWPQHEIDHINRDPGDNRLTNLREATHAQNSLNRAMSRNRLRGGTFFRGKWKTRIQVYGKNHFLGNFDTAEEADAAYRAAAAQLHGEFYANAARS